MKRYILVLILLAAPAMGHDLAVTVRDSAGALAACAAYGRNEPASFGGVMVFAPGDDEVPYQTGSTDRNGCFSFLPDQPGDWVIHVDDEMGHRDQATISVDPGSPEEARPTAGSQPVWQKLLIGLSLIVGVSGFLYGFMNKKLQS